MFNVNVFFWSLKVCQFLLVVLNFQNVKQNASSEKRLV